MTDNVEELKNEIILLRIRIAELEKENSELRERENAAIIANAMKERINGIRDS